MIQKQGLVFRSPLHCKEVILLIGDLITANTQIVLTSQAFLNKFFLMISNLLKNSLFHSILTDVDLFKDV